MSSTRIFVKNLPASLSVEDFRRHFSKQAPVTDAKYIAHRRLGYVGYRTATDAERAVRYFHKSFLGMARLCVQLAQSVEAMREKPTAAISAVPPAKPAHDEKLQEYLHVMQAPSTLRTWENHEGPALARPVVNEQDAEYEDLPAKRRRITNDEEPALHEHLQPQIPPEASKSDADWLRARTTRVLEPAEEPVIEEVQETPEETKEIVPNSAPCTDRLFARNLPYTATEDELREHFRSHGNHEIVEMHIAVDSRTGQNKGFAHLRFKDDTSCAAALQQADQQAFQGRLLHLLPSQAKPNELDMSQLPLKKQQQLKKRAEAANFNWNSLFMNPDAVLSSVSDRLKVSKSELLDPTSSSAAVTQAHAETQVILETKAYFQGHKIDLTGKARSDVSVLVKNFPFGTTPQELRDLFEPHGSIKHLLMPPAGTIAIVVFEQAAQAKSALGALAYRKFKNSILFLERGPASTTNETESPIIDEDVAKVETKIRAADVLDNEQVGESTTLFVSNLNFATTTARLEETFKPLAGFRSARVKTRTDAKKPGQILSMGFGFVEFDDTKTAVAAMTAMQGHRLDQHDLLVRPSQRTLDEKPRAKRNNGTKIIIKNLPFEATKRDVRSLFSAYGQLRSVRVPQKFGSSTRGFAFADFTTVREASNAINALRDTHLLGRRLALDFAANESVDPEDEIARMQQKVGAQSDKMAVQRLVSGSARRKFAVDAESEM